MSSGNFMQGMLQGGIAVNRMFNDNSDQRIKEQAAARAQKEFDDREQLKAQLGAIGKEEAAAQEAGEKFNSADNQEKIKGISDLVTDPNAIDQIMKSAVDINTSAQGDAAISDGVNAGATPLSEIQKIGLRDAIQKQASAAKKDPSSPEAVKFATEVASAQQANAQSFNKELPTLDRLNADAAASKPAIEKQFDGIKSAQGMQIDEINSYRFAMRRAAAFAGSGDFKAAQEIKGNAAIVAAGVFADAILTGNDHKAFQLYNAYNNGHDLSSLRTNKDGTLTAIDTKGKSRTVSRMDVIAGAIAHSGNPEKAAELIQRNMSAEDKAQFAQLRAQQEQARLDAKNSQDAIKNDLERQRLENQKNYQDGSLSIRRDIAESGNAKSGKGKGNNNQDEGYDSDGTISFDTFKEIAKLSSDPNNPESAGLNTKVYYDYLALAKSNNGENPTKAQQWELIETAKDIATGKKTVTSELNADGVWDRMVMNKNGLGIPYQKRINPTSILNSEGAPEKTKEQVIQTIQERFPTAYDEAFKVANDPQALAKMQTFINMPNAEPKARHETLLRFNLANQILDYSGTERPKEQPATAKKSTPRFNADELARFEKLGITPNKPFMQKAGELYDKAGEVFKSGAQDFADAQQSRDLEAIRTGSDNRFSANRLYTAIKNDPLFARRLSQEDIDRITAYSTNH